MVANLDSQVARLNDRVDSGDDSDVSDESEGSIDNDGTPEFFVPGLFASGVGGHKRRVRDQCTRLIAKSTTEKFCCATCQRKFCDWPMTLPLTTVHRAL